MEESESQDVLGIEIEDLRRKTEDLQLISPTLNSYMDSESSAVLVTLSIIVESVSRAMNGVDDIWKFITLIEIYNCICEAEYIERLIGRDDLRILSQYGWREVESTQLKFFEENLIFYIAAGKERIVEDEHGISSKEFCTMYLIRTSFKSDHYSAFDYLEVYVMLLKEIAAKKPYCIVSYIEGHQLTLRDLDKLKNSNNEESMNIVRKFSQLIDEIEKIDLPLIAVANDIICDLGLSIFLAFPYRIAMEHQELKIRLTDGWKQCFLVGGILKRFAFLSSPVLALNFLSGIFRNKTSNELRAFGIINEICGSVAADAKLNTYMFINVLNKALNISFIKMKDARKSICEKRFMKIDPNSSLWTTQLDKMLNKSSKYQKLFEKSVSYLQKIRTNGMEKAIDYEVEIAIELRDTLDTRIVLDGQYASRSFNERIFFQKYCSNTEKTIGIIGCNAPEYLAAVFYLKRKVNVFCITKQMSVLDNMCEVMKPLCGGFKTPNSVQYSGTFTALKGVDIVIISQLVGQYENVCQMINDIEDIVEHNTPICLGFCEMDLKAVQSVARYPERIFGLYFWLYIPQFYAANLTINGLLQTESSLFKIKSKISYPDLKCIYSYLHNYSELLFIRTILSVISEVSQQLTEGSVDNLDKVEENLTLTGLNAYIFLIADLIGLDNLLRSAIKLQPFNESKAIYWNLTLIEKLVAENKVGARSSCGLVKFFGLSVKRSFTDVSSIVTPRSDRKVKKCKQKVLCDRLLLSFLNEPVRWYVEKNLKPDACILYEMNYALLHIFGFQQNNMGVFRFIDENLYKYSDVINKGGKYYNFLKDRLKPDTPKFFSNTPIHRSSKPSTSKK